MSYDKARFTVRRQAHFHLAGTNAADMAYLNSGNGMVIRKLTSRVFDASANASAGIKLTTAAPADITGTTQTHGVGAVGTAIESAELAVTVAADTYIVIRGLASSNDAIYDITIEYDEAVS
jgi:hypothetical protein